MSVGACTCVVFRDCHFTTQNVAKAITGMDE